MFEYPAEIKKDSNGSYLVNFPDIPEAHTFGVTRDDAIAHASEALETALSFYVEEGKPLPKSSAKRGKLLIGPSLIGEMKLGIYKSMYLDKVRKTDLARRMGVALMQIDRILDLTHSSRIEQLESAYAALGKKVHVELLAAE